MRQFKLQFVLFVLLGISIAWTNKTSHPMTLHQYGWKSSSVDGSKYYIIVDITSAGYQKGVDYDCAYSGGICSFYADPIYLHTDASGSWFYVTNIPTSGINTTGYFEYLDY